MLTDFRKPLLRISLVAGFTEPLKRGGEVVKDKLATLDRGAPASQDTVARESTGHLGTVRHRAEEIEYRVGRHREVLWRTGSRRCSRYRVTWEPVSD
jgi:hypothetical protein